MLFGLPTSAQDLGVEEKVERIYHKIVSTDNGEKLKWMDSLCRLVERKEVFKYDSLARKTIDYALELDSTRLALLHAKTLIAHIHDDLEGPEKAVEVFNNINDRVPKNQHFLELIRFYNEGAYSYKVLNRLDDALSVHEQAYKFAIKTNDSTRIGGLKEQIGEVLCFMGDFQRAATTLQEAYQILSKHAPESAWEPKATLSILYSQNGLQEEAKKLRMEIVAEARKYGNMRAIHNQFFNQAFDEMLHGSQKERIRYLDSTRTYSFKTNNKLLEIELLIAQLSAYAENGMLEKAELVKKQLEERLKSVTFQVDEYNLAMAHYEFANGNYEKAAVWGEKEYDKVKDAQFYEGIYMAHGFLSKVYNKLGDLKKAHFHLKAHHRIKDSIETVQKANGFSYYQTLYETEKRDFKIASQQNEIILLDNENKMARQWMLFGGIGIITLFSILYLVRSRQFAVNKKQLQEQFSRNLINEREEERTRLARELHDSVGQKLMLLTRITKSKKDNEMEELAGSTLEELRSISRGLHPIALKQLDTTLAIRTLIDEMDANSDIFFTHKIDNIDAVLNKESSLHLFRIIQEVLSNILRHAQATSASIEVDLLDRDIEILIEDNGKGFNFENKIKEGKSLGMRTLLERAKIINSKLHIKSELGKGTKIFLTVPIS